MDSPQWAAPDQELEMVTLQHVSCSDSTRPPRGRVVTSLGAALLWATAAIAPATHADPRDDSFTIKPESVAFGRQPLFTSHTESFWIRNKGKSAVSVATVELRGAQDKEFKVQHDCRGTVAVEGQCRVKVTFEPTSGGAKSAELHIMAGDKSVRTRPVTGTGVQAKFDVSDNAVAFGKVQKNSSSKPHTVTIRNSGDVALPVTATSLSGANEHQFAQSNDCPPELGVGKSCASTVVFKPTSNGAKTATLTVWAKGGAAEKTVTISGTGS